MASSLEATVRPEADGALITLSGRVDRDGDQALVAAYAAARETGSGPITLDFTATDYINSTGIALIVRLLAEARRDRRDCGRRRPLGALPGDLPDHPTLGLHDDRRPGTHGRRA